MSMKRSIFIGMALAFFILGFVSLQRAMPEQKDERMYKAISLYSPYKFEKTIGGLNIINSKTGDKEKPDAASVMHRMDELQKEWGKTHLKVTKEHVIVLGDNKQEITKIAFENPLEKKWVENFYGIKESN
ncbi:MAG: hypothetical protein GXO11_08590 [Epsilonproteobacteria bacterium]|nr:hypothetical protein [Campylobacterota bacterium]